MSFQHICWLLASVVMLLSSQSFSFIVGAVFFLSWNVFIAGGKTRNCKVAVAVGLSLGFTMLLGICYSLYIWRQRKHNQQILFDTNCKYFFINTTRNRCQVMSGIIVLEFVTTHSLLVHYQDKLNIILIMQSLNTIWFMFGTWDAIGKCIMIFLYHL